VVLHSTEHKHGKCYLWIKTKLKQNDMKHTCNNKINQVYDRHYEHKGLGWEKEIQFLQKLNRCWLL